MPATLLPIILVLIGGIGVAIQAPTNAMLARTSGSVVLAALISFAIGTLTLTAIWLAGDRGSPAALRGVPAWAWMGGLYGAFYVTIAAFAAPRLGLGAMLTLMIASQLGTALVLDHFGLLGLPRNPASIGRVAGVLMVLAGVVLVRRG
jgi:transporter family-2 protein